MSNKPDAVNPAMTLRFAIVDRWRQVTNLGCYMRSASACAILVASVIATPLATGIAADTHATAELSEAPPLTGTFVSSPQRSPVYIIELNTNGTYELVCSVQRFGTDINGDRIYTYPGLDSGTWRWRPEMGEYSLTSTNLRTAFPLKLLRYHAGDTNRLEAVDALLLRDPWLVRKKDP